MERQDLSLGTGTEPAIQSSGQVDLEIVKMDTDEMEIQTRTWPRYVPFVHFSF